MRHLHEAFPNIKEIDSRMYTLNAIGLTIPAICMLLKERREVIYNRRLRLRSRIQESDTPHRDQLLKYLR